MDKQHSSQATTIRLNKFLAERLGVSRREADEIISSGKVLIDDQPAVLGSRIDKSSKVCYNNKIVPFETEYSYIAFNKPVGYVCSRRAQGSAPTLYDLLPREYSHLKTVGRLDKDSSGLILLTNDGDFAFQMTHPKFRKNKVYEVELDRPLEPLHQQMISDYGVEIGDGVSRFKIIKDTSAGDAAWGSPSRASARMGEGAAAGPTERYLAILSEGRNRQIRRTFAALGYHVTRLHRTEFGKYTLGDLKPGCFVVLK